MPQLNTWLATRAVANHQLGTTRCYVVVQDKRTIGFYGLAAGALEHVQAASKIRRNMPDPIPVIILGRLAVDVSFQGKGLGAALLLDALQRTQGIADTVGVRAMLVNAKNQRAADFYERFRFVPSPLSKLTLMQLV